MGPAAPVQWAAVSRRAAQPRPPITLRSLGMLVRDTAFAWSEDNAARIGASHAFYTHFSLAPCLIIVIAVAGLAFGREAAEGRIVAQIQGLIGPEGGQAVAALLAEAGRRPGAGLVATLTGLATMLLGASAVFAELRSGLNEIWGVPPQPGGTLVRLVRARFKSFTLVLGIGFLLLVSLIVSAAVAALTAWLGAGATLIQAALSFAMSTALFAMIFKLLPDVRIAWQDVWVGAAATALFFTIGQALIGLYLGHSTVRSVYGAAGSLVLILLWVYYSAQVFFVGAEFTQVYANRFGSRSLPSPFVPDDARA